MRRLLLALTVLAGVLAAVTHELLFVHGSIDNDEVVYLLQGRLIASGHLLLHTPSPGLAYQPWFFAGGPHGLVPKYWPTVGALFGLSLWVTGSIVPALVLDAMALPLLTFGFCRGFLSPRRSLLAAAVVSLSPLVVIQSGLALSYLPFAVMMVAIWWLLRVVSTRPTVLVAAALGVVFSVAVATRPLDSVLLTLPAAVAVGARLLRSGGLARAGAGAVLGLLPGAVLIAVYDVYATGSVTRLPFNALEPEDTVGFGQRRLFPEDSAHYFGPRQSVDGFYDHFLRGPVSWFTAGAVILPLAVVALSRWGSLAFELRWLAASTGVFFLGYLYFWGPYNASVLWGGPHSIGPFYALAVLVPVTALACSVPLSDRSGARSGAAARSPRGMGGLRLVALVVVLAAVALSVSQAVVSSVRTRHQSSATDAVLAAVDRGHAASGDLVVEAGAPYLGHPVSEVLNPVGGSRLTALNVVPPQAPNDVLLQIAGDPYATGGPNVDLVRQHSLTGAAVTITTGWDEPSTQKPGGRYALLVQQGSLRMLCAVDARHSGTVVVAAGHAPQCGTPSTVPLRLAGDSVDGCDGRCVDLTLMQFGPGRGIHRVASRHLPERVTAGRIEVSVDGPQLLQQGAGWLTVSGVAR